MHVGSYLLTLDDCSITAAELEKILWKEVKEINDDYLIDVLSKPRPFSVKEGIFQKQLYVSMYDPILLAILLGVIKDYCE